MSDDIREKMWKAMADSPFLMIGLENTADHSQPMTAQLDKDADGKFWFYTNKQNRLAPGGPAMAQFSAKGHDLFACIKGTLVTETDPAVIDAHWSKQAAAWYQEGREDPNLLMLRFELDDAEIWEADMSIKGLFRLMTGHRIKSEDVGDHAEVSLD
ncbi:general stress protein [Sphingomonas koreensis]|nr:general stress protein [Sphingomonas koreensis]